MKSALIDEGGVRRMKRMERMESEQGCRREDVVGGEVWESASGK
jgi:hypothetical protein